MFISKDCKDAGLYPYLGEGGERSKYNFDVQLLVMDPGTERVFYSKTKETAFLLFEGNISFCISGNEYHACRKSLFTELPSGLHAAAGEKIILKAETHCELYIQMASNNNAFPHKFYTPKDIILQRAGGHGVLNGCMERSVRTLFDDENAPYSNMVLGEVASPPGLWSSYPPHFHPQPEAYFFRFSDPRGFGFGYDGENIHRTVHNSLILVGSNGTHEQVTAPGYAMCFVWGILHLKEDRWLRTRIEAPEHTWLSKKNAEILKPSQIL